VDIPTIVDAEGNIIDGWHRERACCELRIQCPREVREFASEAEKFELALTANCKRRQLNRKQKRKLIESYLKVDPAISDNTLAETIGGISKNTITQVRHRLERTRQIDKLTEFRGKDGKTRPRKYKRIIANNSRELTVAQVTIRQLPDSCDGKILDLTTASRRAKRNVKREQLAGKVIVPTEDEDIRLYHCRFQDLEKRAGIKPDTAAALLTDIPYGKAFLNQVEELSAFAARVLRKGGLFIAHMGVAYLDEKFHLLSRHLTYQWTIASSWGGDSNIYYPLNAINKWKPIVVYSKGPPKPLGRWPDVITARSKEKGLHDWQQPLAEAETLLRYFTEPGDLIIDTCGGSFTTAPACRNMGRRFIGCDIDEQCVLKGLKRLADTPVGIAFAGEATFVGGEGEDNCYEDAPEYDDIVVALGMDGEEEDDEWDEEEDEDNQQPESEVYQ
jgi:site-specific DNA-methyltransferase (adenine-specific)